MSAVQLEYEARGVEVEGDFTFLYSSLQGRQGLENGQTGLKIVIVTMVTRQ